MTFEIPHELKKSIENKKLIIFTGAGISMKEGLPSWGGIVSNVLSEKSEFIDKSEAYTSALDSGIMSPLDILDKIESDKKHIFEIFEKSLSGKGNVSEFINSLSKITTKFITTNFDTLIEDSIPNLRKITKDSSYNLKKIDSDDAYVIKIHGDIEAIDNCIVFSGQYKSLYTDDSLAAFQLKKIFSDYTVLFMGFSFSDPYVAELFDYIANMLDGLGPKHYIITTEKLNHEYLTDIVIPKHSDLDSYVEILVDSTNIEPVHDSNNDLDSEGVSKELNFDQINSSKEDGSDIPPTIVSWVGREKEIDALNKSFKVFFLTGIGGQGKSALAAYYLDSMKKSSDYVIFDWRDFKEEDHKFQNKIISLIMLVKKEIGTEEKYVGLDDEYLVSIFFKSLGNTPAIFVLDNIDRYIDLEDLVPLHGLGVLYKQAIEKNHKSKFIFTCRPFVKLAGLDFFQLPLGGFGSNDVVSYFELSGLSVSSESLSKYAIRAFELTGGHPLWISLIVAQGKRGEKELDKFLSNISKNDVSNDSPSSILSEDILGKIWESLSEKQKIVLRSLAEAVQSLTIEDYSEIVSSELNYNQFTRSLKVVNNLGLIVEKKGGEYIELHPLVKEFIKNKYPRSERRKYMNFFIEYYGRFMLILKPKLSSRFGFSDFSNWTNQIELFSNAKEDQKALIAMNEIHDSMKSAGYIEEYLRVASIVFRGLSWNKLKILNLNMFSQVYLDTTKSSVEYGDKSLSSYLIEKYDSIVENKDPSYVTISEAKAHNSWFNKDYSSAITIYEKTSYLLESANQAGSSSLKHTYALSLRDSGNKENIEKSLDILLFGEELSKVANNVDIDKSLGGAFYGNVGRVLQFMERVDESINCFCKSFVCIYDGDSSDRLLNIGFGCRWLSEALISIGSLDIAFYFRRLALDKWKLSSPPLYNELSNSKTFALNDFDFRSIESEEDWRVEKYCNNWVRERLGETR